MVCVQIQNFLCSFCGGEERAHPGLQRRQQRASGAAEGSNPPLLAATSGQMSPMISSFDSPPSQALDTVKKTTEEIPCVVGDERVWTDDVRYQLSVSQQNFCSPALNLYQEKMDELT